MAMLAIGIAGIFFAGLVGIMVWVSADSPRPLGPV